MSMERMTNKEDLDIDEIVDDGLVDDSDICPAEEIEASFTTKYNMSKHMQITRDSAYIMHIDTCMDTNVVAVAASDYSVNICDLSQLTKIHTLPVLPSAPKGLKFFSSNLLLCGDETGVKIWDTRTSSSKYQVYFKAEPTSDSAGSNVSCFDINTDSRFICAGTELIEDTQDVYLLFFDVRKEKLLGAYSDCHNDDITQVRFHPSDVDTLTTGSTDGLINVFDISQSSEDDALQYTLNTEASVEKLCWFSKKDGSRCVSTTTQSEDVQLWNVEDAQPYTSFSRAELTGYMKRKNEDAFYLVDCYARSETEELLLLCGSASHDACLRLMRFRKSRFKPWANLTSQSYRHHTVRSSCFSPQKELLVTGDQDGVVSVWNIQDVSLPEQGNLQLKMGEKKFQKHKMKPY